MKYSLTIETEEHSDLDEMIDCLKLRDLKCALWDLSQKFRQMRKHGDEKDMEFGERACNIFWEVMQDRDITLD